jgi:hypothetical protein
MRRILPLSKALIEVIAVFGLAALAFRTVYGSPPGTWERQALQRPFLEYVAVMAVPLAVLVLARRDFAAYGIALRNVKPHAMPTSPVYDTTRQQLTQQLPQALASQIETLALVVVGIRFSMSAQIGKIARAMPLDTTHAAKEQRIRRLVDNERLTQTDHYQPLAKAALTGLKGQRVNLLIDRVLVQDIHTILLVSVGLRRRSPCRIAGPVACRISRRCCARHWRCCPHKCA